MVFWVTRRPLMGFAGEAPRFAGGTKGTPPLRFVKYAIEATKVRCPRSVAVDGIERAHASMVL